MSSDTVTMRMSLDERFRLLGRVIENCLPLLEACRRKHVAHYVSVGELEMAFEGMGIEFMAAFPAPPQSDCFRQEEWLLLVTELELEAEAVFDWDFAKNFALWLEGRPQLWSDGIEAGLQARSVQATADKLDD